jgi:hypothetical protein
MAAPSLSQRSKTALDQLIQSYLQKQATTAGAGDEQMQVDEFEMAYFRDVVGASATSCGDLVSTPSFERLLAWASCSLDEVRPELLHLCYQLFLKR